MRHQAHANKRRRYTIRFGRRHRSTSNDQLKIGGLLHIVIWFNANDDDREASQRKSVEHYKSRLDMSARTSWETEKCLVNVNSRASITQHGVSQVVGKRSTRKLFYRRNNNIIDEHISQAVGRGVYAIGFIGARFYAYGAFTILNNVNRYRKVMMWEQSIVSCDALTTGKLTRHRNLNALKCLNKSSCALVSRCDKIRKSFVIGA